MRNPTRYRPIVLWLLLISLSGCGVIDAVLGPARQPPPVSRMRESVVERLKSQVQREFDVHLAPHQKEVLEELKTSDHVAARFKQVSLLQGLTDPWGGMSSLERQALLLAELAEAGRENLPAVIDILEAGMDRTAEFFNPLPFPPVGLEKSMAFMIDTLDQAYQLREKALKNLSGEDQRFLFAHARSLAERFIPHQVPSNGRVASHVPDDAHFAELLAEKVDYAAMIAAAQVLTRLGDDRWLRLVWSQFQKLPPVADNPPGVTGDILLVKETPYGTIVIGGLGPNTYELDKRISLLIDLGGDDSYRGTIASAGSAEQGNSVVIDLMGNDLYEAAPLGLATGRLGVGLLIDLTGHDVYQLEVGSGGAGFAGLGILSDGKGDDVYKGSRFTQGAAIGGLGLLLDHGGDDRYTSHGYALGFGGPLGLGAVIDVKGDDVYDCGGNYPSQYNEDEHPGIRPADPKFQYDCFGLGTGSGARVFTKKPDLQQYSLAGGWGLLLDLEGHDKYQSANFSQGMGYFFGAGMKLDLDGDDEHVAARYGHGASAHYGLGLFLDVHGDDRYGSSGPYYNGGVAWDSGAALAVDAGTGTDVYDLQNTTGLGRADYGGWAVFVEEGGQDRYAIANGLGQAAHKSLAGFFDLSGKDQYILPYDVDTLPKDQRANGRVIVDERSALFVDQ